MFYFPEEPPPKSTAVYLSTDLPEMTYTDMVVYDIWAYLIGVLVLSGSHKLFGGL